jgi:hypothetical protein
VDPIGIEPMTFSCHFGNVTQLIETRWHRPHSTPLITCKNAVIGLVLAAVPPASREGALTLTPAMLRKMVLDAVSLPHSKRSYTKALDNLFVSVPARLSPGNC